MNRSEQILENYMQPSCLSTVYVRKSEWDNCPAVSLIGFRAELPALCLFGLRVAAVDNDFHPALKSCQKGTAMGRKQ
jgi:hypothetical protein